MSPLSNVAAARDELDAHGKDRQHAELTEGQRRARHTATRSGHKDFLYTTLGNTLFVEWAAFSGVVEHLDGPAREGMGDSWAAAATLKAACGECRAMPTATCTWLTWRPAR